MGVFRGTGGYGPGATQSPPSQLSDHLEEGDRGVVDGGSHGRSMGKVLRQGDAFWGTAAKCVRWCTASAFVCTVYVSVWAYCALTGDYFFHNSKRL